jgi:hypothetical protein
MRSVLFMTTNDEDVELRDMLAGMQPTLSAAAVESLGSPRHHQLLDSGIHRSITDRPLICGCWKTIRGVLRCTYFWGTFKLVVALSMRDQTLFVLGRSGEKIILTPASFAALE